MDARRMMRVGAAGLPAIGLLAIGLAVRLWHIAAEPLWLDEAYSAYAADHGLAFLWRVVPLYEVHPPFYYTLLHAWVAVAGDGLAALRAFGALAGIATLPAVAWAADEAARWLGWPRGQRRALAFAAFGLACVSIALVEMTRQVRPYPLMILVYVAATALVLRLGRRAAMRRPVGGRALALHLLLVEAMLWLHNLGPLFALALTVALAIAVMRRGMPRSDWAWLAGGHALVALAYLPGLAILAGQAPTWRASTWLRFGFDQTLLDRVMTLYGVPGWGALVSLALAAAAFVAARGRPRVPVSLLVLATLPVLLAILLSLAVTPVFVTRIMTPVAAPALLLLAIGAVGPALPPLAGRGAALVLGAWMLAGDVQARAGGAMQDWYRVVAWLQPRLGPGDRIYAYPNEGALPLGRALRDKGVAVPIRPIPSAVPSLERFGGWHPSGTRGVSSLPPGPLRAIAAEPATRGVPTIWLLRLGPETFDPGDVLLRALRRDRVIVRSFHYGPIEVTGLRRRPPN